MAGNVMTATNKGRYYAVPPTPYQLYLPMSRRGG
jgi:hypothetical protein